MYKNYSVLTFRKMKSESRFDSKDCLILAKIYTFKLFTARISKL